MDLGTLYVKLDMLTADFDRKLTRSEQRLERFEKRTKQTGQRMIEIGSKLAAGITLPLGLATYQAGRFEQSMLDLQKVTDKMTMENLRRPLLEMSETIPESASDLAGLATQAGRFGVQGSKNIQKFTKTTAQMAVATDLTAEDAGKSLAKLSKMTETPIDEIDNLASGVVKLGNNFATSESEIVKSAMRSASALRDMGASQQEIMALSAALNEVFPSARRAGTGARRVAQQLTGPKQAREVANIMGIQVERFREMRENAPVQTLLKLSQALQRGGERGRALKETFTSVVRKTLTNLAGNISGVNDALNQMNEGYAENTALAREADIQSKGLLNRLKNLWDSIKNVGTAIGQITMPAVKDITTAFQGMLNTVESLISAFNKLPGVLKTPLSYLTTMSMLAPVGLMGAGLARKGAGMVAGTMRAGMGQLRKAGTWLNQPAAMGVMAGAGGRGRHRMRRPQMPDRGTQLKTQARAKLSKLKSTFTGVAAGEGIRRIASGAKTLLKHLGKILPYLRKFAKIAGKGGIIVTAIVMGFQALVGVLTAVGSEMKETLERFRIWNDMAETAGNMASWVADKFKGLWDNLKLVGTVYGNLAQTFEVGTHGIINVLSGAILQAEKLGLVIRKRFASSAEETRRLEQEIRNLEKALDDIGVKDLGPIESAWFKQLFQEDVQKRTAKTEKMRNRFQTALNKKQEQGKKVAIEYLQQLKNLSDPLKAYLKKLQGGKDAMEKQADSAERIQMALQSASQAWEDMFRATLQGMQKDQLKTLAENVASARTGGKGKQSRKEPNVPPIPSLGPQMPWEKPIEESVRAQKKERKDKQRDKKEKSGATKNVSNPEISNPEGKSEMPVPMSMGMM